MTHPARRNLPTFGNGLKAILWDIDGTLIDTTDLILDSLGYTYNMYQGLTIPRDELKTLIGIPLYRQMRWYADGQILDFANIANTCIGYYEAHRDQERVLSDVTELLKLGFKLGLKTALVTSKNHPELANTLPRLGIEDYLNAAITADDVPRPKPAPDSVVLALELLGIGAHEAVFVGDTIHDMQAGAGAGVARIAVLWGASTKIALELEQAEAICATPNDLARCLGLPRKELSLL